jgi:hypothetical protein
LTPLELDGWLDFNGQRTGLTAHRFSTSGGGAEARAVLYLDRRGRVKLPPDNPYLPVVFESASQRPSSRTADWLRVAAPLVEEMRRRGLANLITFPPDVEDVRPWRWRSFLVGVRYTSWLDFPYDSIALDRGAKRSVDKALKHGMTVERTDDVTLVAECLAETAANAGFAPGIGRRELDDAATLLGPDHLRMYVCHDRDGRAASSCAVLHAPAARALSWQAGTKRGGTADGASQLMWRFVFDDLAAAGATGLDSCGANIESVADFKSRLGFRLRPTYTVRTYALRTAARFIADWLHSR